VGRAVDDAVDRGGGGGVMGLSGDLAGKQWGRDCAVWHAVDDAVDAAAAAAA
jgi:hypothetical protein